LGSPITSAWLASSSRARLSHIIARPRHPAQDQRTIEAFKKTSPPH
jgi:hypothetical protein